MATVTLTAQKAIDLLSLGIELNWISSNTLFTLELPIQDTMLRNAEPIRIPPHVPTNWEKQGVILPDNTILRIKIKDGKSLTTYMGLVKNGLWEIDFNGAVKKFKNPSPAASTIIALHTSSPERSINGWDHWDAKLPNEKIFRNIGSMRPKDQRIVRTR